MKNLSIPLFAIVLILCSCSLTQKANINTSRSNIKRGLNNPADSLQQKANINTSRSNIKRGLNNPADSLQQKANINTSRSNIKKSLNNPADSLQQKANINTSRSNIKRGLNNPADSLQQKGKGIIVIKDGHKGPIKGPGHGGMSGHVTLVRGHQPNVYVGGGHSVINNSTKEGTNLSNTNDVNIGIYLPLIKKASLSYGVNFNIEYNFSDKSTTAPLRSPFIVAGQTSSSVALIQSEGQPQSAYLIGIGPQINFYLGNKFLLSPLLQANYINIKQQAFSTEQTTNTTKENYTFTIQNQVENKNSFFAIKPAIRLEYLLSKKIGIWTEANYTMGSSIKTTNQQFFPEGNISPTGQYTLAQMQNGTLKNEITNTKFNSLGLKLGVALKLTKSKEVKFKAGAELSDKVN